MHRVNFFISCLSLMTLGVACSNDDSTDDPTPAVRKLSVSEAELVASANDFNFELMTEVEKEFPEENYFISSFSVKTALSMVMNGASGTVQQGFIETLGLQGTPAAINEANKSLVSYIYSLDPSITLNVANSNWYSDKLVINNDFANTLSEYYNAQVFKRDFENSATLDALNGWVEDETNGKIKNILDKINPQDAMFLINAIYFKANWTTQFDTEATRDLPFQLSSTQTVTVPTMVGEVKHWWAYDNTLKAQLIEIPYGNENYAFTIVMPDDVEDINNLVSKINSNELNNALADSTTYIRDLYLPKFQLDFKTNLRDALVNMGMPLIGLDNLFENELEFGISKVIHQSFLEVNEEGSEAAAATVIGIEVTSLPPSTTVNKPFIFLIRERNSGTILFSGKLLDPR